MMMIAKFTLKIYAATKFAHSRKKAAKPIECSTSGFLYDMVCSLPIQISSALSSLLAVLVMCVDIG